MSHHEQPVFGLGLSGFAPGEKKELESRLASRAGRPRWRFGAFAEADAWWINGARVRLMPDGMLRIAPGLPNEKALRLDLAAVDRPVAFATPLALAEPGSHRQFDPRSPLSIEQTLLQFDAWLRQARAQFVLGARIVEAGEQFDGGVYHVSHENRLLAVIDFEQRRAAFMPRAHPVALWEARWSRRPTGAHDLPESFAPTTPAELAWMYARHSERNLLPSRYRHRTIHYRRVPRVPLRMLRDSQLQILNELATGGLTLDELEVRTAWPRQRLERDLACLYFANAITTAQRNPDSIGRLAADDPVLRVVPHQRQDAGLTTPVMLELGADTVPVLARRPQAG
ncbi:hypothetical protein [Ramlibacter tataouinensis]|uniref:Uncharacterized protein n=1 Tax=Ramlibacter tataouinensis TaxID=94132 RepID=A0A127JQI4_9BURK|nr:hypothetical protein [Ramlibacter tataouinensis]AMO22226.1 hypothetical protein UC35_04130 [Ramlibacter tataouinensis]